MKTFMLRALPALLLVASPGCSDDEGGSSGSTGGESYTQSVPMAVTGVDEGDVAKGEAREDADASAATSGRWASFLSSAEAECGGPPAGFQVDGVSLSLEVLGGLLSADTVFTGNVNFLLCDRPLGDPAAVVVNVASTADVEGLASGTATLDVTADPGSLEPLYQQLLDGTFYVGLSGETSTTLGQTFVVDASFDVQMRAICP